MKTKSSTIMSTGGIVRLQKHFLYLLSCFVLLGSCTAFVMSPSNPRSAVCVFSETVTSSSMTTEGGSTNDSEDDDEWEYEEFENLEEKDFYNSEWKVGTCWDDRSDKIEETWCRLIIDETGNNVCIWGDGAKGKWKFDLASQFLQMSKETFGGWGGKKLWAGVVDDFYYLRGTVRGWGPIQPANVLAQWQAKRLGVDPEEAGEAPWFETESSSESDQPKLEQSDD